MAIRETATGIDPAVYGEHQGGTAAVWGNNVNDTNAAGPGVMGSTIKGTGVIGQSTAWMGVYGRSESTIGGAGVMGEAVGSGVIGKSQTWHGLHGESQSTTGGAGVSGRSVNPDGTVNQDGLAGFFDGKVVITNDIILSNADCAEDFDVTQSETIEPGTVMVIYETGALQQSRQAYDKRVAGVVSGAGGYNPGIVLDKQDSQANRVRLALLGKVYCKVDAQYGSIGVGDLLTTSSSPGHAMKATDPLKAFGAVIGKALRPLEEGQALIPILIALQ